MTVIWQKLTGSLSGSAWPALIALAGIILVALFLFAYPLVSAALGFAVPFLIIGTTATVVLAMNMRWTLWHGRRPLSFSISDLGFLLCFGSFGFYGFASLADSWATLPYIVMGMVIIGLFRTAFLEFEAWWLGIALAGLLSLVFGSYIAFTFLRFGWFFDFGASLLLVAGIALLLAGSLASILESPRSSMREKWPGWLRLSSLALGLLLFVALGTSAGVTLAGTGPVASEDAVGVLRIEFDGGRLDLSRTTWSAGTVEAVVANHDLLVHNFSIDALGVDETIAPKSEHLIRFDLPSGDYRFECGVPGHSEGTHIHVP